MKSEKGVTMVSLIIYVIAMLITVTIITVVTSYFTKNIDVSEDKYTYFAEFTKFESFFSEEVNKENNKILDIGTIVEDPTAEVKKTQSFIAFSSGNQYTYIPENKAIYQNNVKITSGVDNCTFTEKFVNGKEAVNISITIKDKTKELQYVFK
ncbi:MAG: hypothetical protein IJH76_04470 [Clostridia bacterium]|nr:hypothetical protein [Clostridia bacterium]